MVKDLLTPDYIFESSWEVCNKVGGIYNRLVDTGKYIAGKVPRQNFLHRS